MIFVFQLSVDPASDDSQVDDALLVLNDVCSLNDVRPKLVELSNFVLKTSNSNKDKIVPVFILASFPDFFVNSEIMSDLKSAVSAGLFPVNLMSDVGIVDDIDNREAQRVWGSVAAQFTAAQWKILLAGLNSSQLEVKKLKTIFLNCENYKINSSSSIEYVSENKHP